MSPVYSVQPEWRRPQRSVGFGLPSVNTGEWDYYYTDAEYILDFEGLDGTTVFTNTKSGGGTVTRNGSLLSISTSDSKYGNSSLYCPPTTTGSDRLLLSFFNDANYTQEFWAKPSVSGLKINIDYYGASGYSKGIVFSNTWSGGEYSSYITEYAAAGVTNSTEIIDIGTTVPTTEWTYHSLQSDTSREMAMYHYNGELIRAWGSTSGSIPAPVDSLARNYKGYLDSIRITGGTSTVPTRYFTERYLLPGTIYPSTGTATSFDSFYQLNKLVLNFSSDFTDTSGWDHTLTANGGASISTSEFKFSSGSFNASSGAYLTVDSNDSISSRLFINEGWKTTDTQIVSDTYSRHTDYTVECWVKVNATDMKAAVFTADTNNNKDVVAFGIYTPASTRTVIGTAQCPQNINASILTNIDIPSNTWSHIVWARKSGRLKIYINGALGYDAIVDHGSGYLRSIGAQRNFDNTSTINQLGGYVNDLRVSLGVARYSSTFLDVPTVPITGYPYPYTKPAFKANPYPPRSALLTGGGAGSDQYFSKVRCLVDFNGTNGSTTFSDLSSLGAGRVFTRTGTGSAVTLSSTQSKFGTASLEVSGDGKLVIGDVLSGVDLSSTSLDGLSHLVDVNPYKIPFLVEFWLYVSTAPSTDTFVLGTRPSISGTTDGFAFALTNSLQPRLYYPNISNSYFISGTSLTVGVWNHVAFGYYSEYAFYKVKTVTNSLIFESVTSNITSSRNGDGNITIGSGANNGLVAYVDDLRVTYGAVRYPSGYSVPTTAHPTF